MPDMLDLEDQLAAYIDGIAEPVEAPTIVQASAPSTTGRRRVWLAVAAGAAVPVAAILAVVLLLGRTPDTEQPPAGTDPPVTTLVERTAAPTTATPTTAPPTTAPATTVAPVTAVPSQTPESAAAFGIDPVLAALPLEQRTEILLSVESEGFTWAIGRPPRELRNMVYQTLACDANAEGAEAIPVELLCSIEYTEILRIDADGMVVAAFPTSNTLPGWLEVRPQAVYAGAIADGALPHDSIIRIDRPSLEMRVIVFEHPEWRPDWPEGWSVATPGQQSVYESRIVGSWLGPDGVDVDAIEQLFAGTGPTCATEGVDVADPSDDLPAAVRETVTQLLMLATTCDADGANALLAEGGGDYIPSHFVFPDGIAAGGILGLDTVYELLNGDNARLDSNAMLGTAFEPVATGPVYVWPAAAAEGVLGFLSDAEQQQFIDDFGQEALDAMVAELAYPGPQLRITEDGRWILYAQLDS